MNKILLPEFPGNNLLFHAVAHSNIVDTINLLESIIYLTLRQVSLNQLPKCQWMHPPPCRCYDPKLQSRQSTLEVRRRLQPQGIQRRRRKNTIAL